MSGKREQVVEYVVYRGAFSDEARHPVLSTPELGLAQHARLNELHDAAVLGRHDLVFSIGERACEYELDGKGKRMAQGSTCSETEVTS